MAPPLTAARARAIAALALPITAGMGSQNLLNLVDVAMLGRLGKEEVAAVGLCGMVLWVLTALVQGFSHAVQTMTARRLGEGRKERLHEAMVNAGYLVLLTGVPFTVLMVGLAHPILAWLTDDPAVASVGGDYLTIRLYTIVFIGFNFCFRGYFNGLKQSTLYMKTLMGMHFTNILANYILIFGKFGAPAMGARGAALGTALATTLGCLIFLILAIRRSRKGFSLSPRLLRGKTVMAVLRLGLPSCLQNLTMAMGFLLFFRLAAEVGTTALAATNVLINLNLVCVLPAMGLGLATITLVSNALGEKQPDEAVAWVRGTVTLVVCTLSLVGALFICFPRVWLGLFIPDPEVIAPAVPALVLVGLSQLYDGAGIVLSYAHLGGGASRTVMVISVVNQWLLFLPAAAFCVFYLDGGLLHLWWCMVLYRLVQFGCYAVSIRRGRWLTIDV